MLQIATWNVNSIRIRLPQLLDWLKTTQPAIVALQETKVTDAAFPVAPLEDIGYHVLFSGQKTYNGVALLSRQAGTEIITDLPTFPDEQRRLLGATFYHTLRVLNVYVPNGAPLHSEKYVYKLNWLQHLHQLIRRELERYPHLLVLGDFNIAPHAEDVDDPARWEGGVMVSDAERSAFQALLALGLQDTFRLFPQATASFSWWDYRGSAFRYNRGARIDLILASRALCESCLRCEMEKTFRGLERPSDHVPVVATFAESW